MSGQVYFLASPRSNYRASRDLDIRYSTSVVRRWVCGNHAQHVQQVQRLVSGRAKWESWSGLFPHRDFCSILLLYFLCWTMMETVKTFFAGYPGRAPYALQPLVAPVAHFQRYYRSLYTEMAPPVSSSYLYQQSRSLSGGALFLDLWHDATLSYTHHILTTTIAVRVLGNGPVAVDWSIKSYGPDGPWQVTDSIQRS